jgi:putative hydrolase of the HAD superfamily
MPGHPKGCLLFDWGDTLMRDSKECTGPMKDWPRVEAIPGAAEMLALLHGDWTLALATNAADSDEKAIRLALQRVDLDRWLDKIYCFKKIGYKKPSLEFFQYILGDLRLAPRSLCMVGDNYEADVLGANACSIPAIWFNPHSLEERQAALHRTVHALSALPDALKSFLALWESPE